MMYFNRRICIQNYMISYDINMMYMIFRIITHVYVLLVCKHYFYSRIIFIMLLNKIEKKVMLTKW